MNPMQEIRLEKVTLNIGTGGPGEALEKALKLLKKISNRTPVKTATKTRIPTWKTRPGLEIGAKVTLRKKEAEELLKNLLNGINNKLPLKKFDDFGNFSFGIKEYIDITGQEYDAEIGIIGLEIAVTLEKPGFRIKKRKFFKSRVNKKHRISKEEAIEFIKKKFGVEVVAE